MYSILGISKVRFDLTLLLKKKSTWGTDFELLNTIRKVASWEDTKLHLLQEVGLLHNSGLNTLHLSPLKKQRNFLHGTCMNN